jgi:hypothetical protein
MLHLEDQYNFKIKFGIDSMITLEEKYKLEHKDAV